MSSSVTNSFIQLYDAEVKAAYQRQGSALLGAVRKRTNIGAERVYFPKLGKGHATTKARHADVVPMGLGHSRAYADMADYYAPEYIDDLDQAKTNISLRQDYANASAWALGRETDDVILTAANATTNHLKSSVVGGTAGDFTLKTIAGISKAMSDNDIPLDGRRFAIISPETLSKMQQIQEASSSEFASKILQSGTAPVQYMGFNWVVHTAVDSYQANSKDLMGFFWHMPSMGLGTASDPKTSVDWVPTKVAWLVNSWMSLGATIVDADGVFTLDKA